ncbi:hypothetical protein AB4305_05495 [Nocardia sp. 2YAB30]|uniref:hypothetical protein n=1 Tax=unclassified Nocardia TaxID=2637762 RepID=UPI003F95581D
MRSGTGSTAWWPPTRSGWRGIGIHAVFDAAVAARLLEVFAGPRLLMDGAELAGDPLGTLPVLFHLIWKQVLVADLSVVLSHRTEVRCAPHVANLARVARVADLAEELVSAGGGR